MVGEAEQGTRGTTSTLTKQMRRTAGERACFSTRVPVVSDVKELQRAVARQDSGKLVRAVVADGVP
jgi:hypothetical protein